MVGLPDVKLLLAITREKLGEANVTLAEIELRHYLDATHETIPTDPVGKLLFLRVTHAKSQVVLARATHQSLKS